MKTMEKNRLSHMSYAKAAVSAVVVTATAAANAAAIDVTTVVTSITDNLVPIGLIGGAVLGVTVALKAYHWIRRAM